MNRVLLTGGEKEMELTFMKVFYHILSVGQIRHSETSFLQTNSTQILLLRLKTVKLQKTGSKEMVSKCGIDQDPNSSTSST